MRRNDLPPASNLDLYADGALPYPMPLRGFSKKGITSGILGLHQHSQKGCGPSQGVVERLPFPYRC